MEKILITGANGQLGSEIRNLADANKNIEFIFTDVDDLDITQATQVETFIETNQVTGIINCAAYTAVDAAEDNLSLARKVNVDGPQTLAIAASKHQLKFIHISTDYVFDGSNFKPYVETDPESPIGAYGQTKFDGEKAVFEAYNKAIVIRTSWLYSSHGNNFVKTMKRLMSERPEIGVIFDQVGTPTYAADLAQACLSMITDSAFFDKTGTYHYSNEGAISWFDFAHAIKELLALDCRINALQSFEFPTKTARPHYSVLNKAKIKGAFGLEIPYWKHSLQTCLALIS